jgi:hypothetical protein
LSFEDNGQASLGFITLGASWAPRRLGVAVEHPTRVGSPGKFVSPILMDDFIVSISILIFVVSWERKLFVGSSTET